MKKLEEWLKSNPHAKATFFERNHGFIMIVANYTENFGWQKFYSDGKTIEEAINNMKEIEL